MAFGRRGRGGSIFSPPAGLITQPQGLKRSVPFVYDAGTPANSLQKVEAAASSLEKGTPPTQSSLVKGYQASDSALERLSLKGIRMQVILIADGSGSTQRDWQQGLMQKMVIGGLGFGLNVDADGTIPVITYGHSTQRPVDVGLNNYTDVARLLQPDMGLTDMAGAFEKALQLAAQNNMLTMIINVTDGNPYTGGRTDAELDTKNVVIRTASEPIFVVNLAIRPVAFLEELDDLPSRYEVGPADANGIYTAVENPQGIRLIDNVDSKAFDPSRATPEDFAAAITDELGTFLDMSGRVGTITGIPSVDRTVFV